MIAAHSMKVFGDVYHGKRVLVTGHTGFKGSWLSIWLKELGAEVVGYSLDLPSTPCNFRVSRLDEQVTHLEGDVRKLESLRESLAAHKPEIVFHLAAQPIVRKSYDDPMFTFETNVLGTLHLLECARALPGIRSVVLVTSDKCYHNAEWLWGYRENDRLGGDDPYSASKACAEIAAHAYIKSFFSTPGSPRVCTVRAGNVIGGGDWAEARIVPDCVRAWSQGSEPSIRNPEATRPWQHVLEPLSGYLWLGANLYNSEKLHGESFNFGPDAGVNKSVGELIEALGSCWGPVKWKYEEQTGPKKESTLLKLCCDKALHLLRWRPVLSFEDTVKMTGEWYRAYYGDSGSMYRFTRDQIQYYASQAMERGLPWVQGASLQ